jgi:hypothetical protein
MSVLDEECHRNALNYIYASLSTMPMLRFELFQLCHGKIKSQLARWLSEIDFSFNKLYDLGNVHLKY